MPSTELARPWRPRQLQRLLLAVSVVAAVAGCDSDARNTCFGLGACQSWGEDQIQACTASVADLEEQADRTGCRTEYDAHFGCTADAYTCVGNRPTFRGCEGTEEKLELCLAEAPESPCQELERALAACQGPPPDDLSGATPPVGPAGLACDPASACHDRCYLRSVADVCRPGAAELRDHSLCAASCPL